MSKLKRSRQREALLRILKSVKTHPTADWLYTELKKEYPSISLGTVYRNLALMTRLGIIKELNYGSSLSRYDGNCDEHYHFVCTRCNSVLDIDMEVQKSLIEQAKASSGFDIQSHSLEFYGICPNCKKEKSKT